MNNSSNLLHDGRKSYTTPELTVLGKVEVITRGNSAGTHFDNTYVNGDPVPDPLDIFKTPSG